MKNLVKAVLAVMEDCKGVEKSMTVGSGNHSYKGVSDKDVKVLVGEAMRKHKLIILPTKIQPVHQVDRWEETTNYGTKQKQSVFTEVITEYALIHESGEQITLAGYGHGVDTQDKAAGKATTYAMKYVLLYSFLVATGHIDDSDNTHSNDIPAPPVKKAPAKSKEETFTAYVAKQGGMTNELKGMIAKAKANGWDLEKVWGLIEASGVKTIKKTDLDGLFN